MKIGTKRLSSHIRYIKATGIEISLNSLNYYINKNNISSSMADRLMRYFKVKHN